MTTVFDFLGGDAGVRRLVDRFYDLMETAPEAATVRALHPELLHGSREKLYLFLMGWAGLQAGLVLFAVGNALLATFAIANRPARGLGREQPNLFLPLAGEEVDRVHEPNPVAAGAHDE